MKYKRKIVCHIPCLHSEQRNRIALNLIKHEQSKKRSIKGKVRKREKVKFIGNVSRGSFLTFIRLLNDD